MLGRRCILLLLLNTVALCAAHASVCAGNHTSEQCSALGGVANRCCFYFRGDCQRDARVSIGPKCHEQHADRAACDESDCCSWAEGACASDRDKRGCKTGVEMCACHGYDQAACEAVGCCSYADGSCSSAVGKKKCHSREDAEPITEPITVASARSAGGSLAWLGWTVAAIVLVIAGAIVAKLVKRRRVGERLKSHDGDGGIAIASE